MVRPRTELGSLRYSRFEKWPLMAALLFSLLVHLGIWGGYVAGKKAGWWQKSPQPIRQPVAARPPKPAAQNVDPTIFLDVSQASADAPKQAKYYSNKNSRAANPDTEIDSNQPKLNGRQTHTPKTEDAPRPVKAKPATPTPPQKPTEAKPEAPHPTAAAPTAGTGQSGKPAEKKPPGLQPSPPERPRTLREAQAQQASQLPGLQLQQAGGVRQHNLTASLDAISTEFGSYDYALIEAITQRWYDILYKQHFAYDRTGMVKVFFFLHSDGTITESKISENTVGDMWGYVCQEAIEEAAPFSKWPSEMILKFGMSREIAFTFYYY